MEMYKRAYEKPETEVVELKVQGILCISNQGEGAPEMDEPEF